jgi:predicted acylesterase/phospholipase RssA
LDLKSILRGVPLFTHLNDEDLNLLASKLRKEDYPKGTILFKKGDVGDTMYIVESGQLTVVGDNGDEPIASMGPGNFVGDIALLLPEPRTATVKVSIDARLWLLGQKDFDELLDTRPALALEMLRELSRRLVTTTRKTRKKPARRITALFGSPRGPELSAALHTYLQAPVALLPLPGSKITPQPHPNAGVIHLSKQLFTETTLAESLSHQIEVFKHIVVTLPRQATPLARKAVDLCDTVISVGAPPPWLTSDDVQQKLWRIPADADADIQRIARRLTNRVVGLAMSSGGTRGLAHVGVLKILKEENIPVDMVAGSSAGALFGAFFAAGWSIEKMEAYIELLKTLTHFSNWDFNIPPRTGVVKGKKARDKFLAKPLNHATFEDMQLPLYIIAGDILTGDEVIFDSGSVADAIRASASIPILGDPWYHQGRYLIDGGVVNPLPASVLRDRGADIIIGSNVVQPLKESYSGPLDKMPSVWHSIFNIISAMEAELITKQFPLIDVLIHHGVSAKHTLDFEHVSDLIRGGEESARKMLPAIKDAILNPSDS